MNRSRLSMLALSAIAYTTGHHANISHDTRRAGQLDNYTGLGLLSINDDMTDIGAEGKKPDTVMAKGEIIGDGTSAGSIVQTQQQAAAPGTAAPGTVLSAKDDVAALNSEGKAAIGDPAGAETQQS